MSEGGESGQSSASAGSPEGAGATDGGTAATSAGQAGAQPDGHAGTGDEPARGGSAGASGSSGDVESAAVGGASGQSSGDGGNGNEAGAAASGGSGEAGAKAGGEAGAGALATFRVSGKVENVWGYPLNGVTVRVTSASGNSSSVTNATGDFTIDDVASPYDASFVVSARAWDGAENAREGWSFQGLTRSDPVFRVERGGYEASSEARLDSEGLERSLEPAVGFAVGTPYGQTFDVLQNLPSLYQPLWLSGPEAADGTAHALAFLTDSSTQLPTSFLAYASQPITIDTNELHSDVVTLDLSPPTPELTADTIAGTITGASFADRQNSVWLMFDSNAAIRLGQEEPGEASFSYLVPALPSAKPMVTASVGGWPPGSPLAIGYRNGLLPGASAIEVRVPSVSSPTVPLPDATIGANTTFGWQASAAVSVLVVEQLIELEPLRRLHVVVAGDSARIPGALLADVGFDSTEFGSWTVETHGASSDVDATANPSGFLTLFLDKGPPLGPLGTSGGYTRSSAVRCGFAP